jgi:AcrR family transcriptional regulator
MEAEMDAVVAVHEAEDTRDRILESSRKLFAEKGFDLTSVRDITTDAGCNVASVNYHFGGKDNLYLETFRSMLAFLREQRLSVLDELMQRTPPPSLEEFLRSFAEGFIDPLTDESRGRLFMALVSREMCDARLPHDVFFQEFIHPILDRAMAAMAKFGPQLEPAAARMCIMSMVGQLLHALRAHHLFTTQKASELMPERLSDYVSHFVTFSVGGINACAVPTSIDSSAPDAGEAVS